MSRPTEEMYVLFIGDVGVGKSSLIKACRHAAERKIPKTGKSGSGVTKEFAIFRLQNVGNMKVWGVDAIGIGDHSLKMSEFIANVEELSRQFPINAICLLNDVVTGRVGLAAQVVSTIIQLGIIEHDSTASDRIVVVGTKADNAFDEDGNRYDPQEINDWETKVVPHFDKFLGFMPHHVVWTGVPKKGKPEISHLLAKLQEIGNDVSVQMKEVENQKFVNFLKENTGFEMASQQEMLALDKEMKLARIEAEKQIEAIKVELQERLAAAERQRKQELEAAEKQRKQEQEAAERRRKQDLDAAEQQRLAEERQHKADSEAAERLKQKELDATEKLHNITIEAAEKKRKDDLDSANEKAAWQRKVDKDEGDQQRRADKAEADLLLAQEKKERKEEADEAKTAATQAEWRREQELQKEENRHQRELDREREEARAKQSENNGGNPLGQILGGAISFLAFSSYW